jgi:hypothetical protein
MLLDVKKISEHVSYTYFQRGRAYYSTKMVSAVTIDNNSITGKVRGSRQNLYKTSIFFNKNEIIDSRCSCPIGRACKHVAALYLEAMDVFPHISSEKQSIVLFSESNVFKPNKVVLSEKAHKMAILFGIIVFFIIFFIGRAIIGPTRCSDGWNSPSIGRQGACSHHDGVNYFPSIVVTFLSLGAGTCSYVFLKEKMSKNK